MIIQFTLSMPNRGSWNGQWSGASRFYALVKSFTSKKGKENAAKILSKPSYHYSWSDGWGASVRVSQITSDESRRVKKSSNGFCGYEWMVESIITHGEIYGSQDEIPAGINQPQPAPEQVGTI